MKLAKKLEKYRDFLRNHGNFGPSVEIRTRGLLNPIQARYQTSPHPETVNFNCQSILAYCFKKSKYFFDDL